MSDILHVALLGRRDDLEAVLRWLRGEVKHCPRDAREAVALQLAQELRAAEDEEGDEGEGDHAATVGPRSPGRQSP